MKTRLITLLAAFAALISSVSCTNNSGKDEIIYYSFATVNKNGANDNSKLTYITDDARLLIPDSPAPAAFKAREGQRVVLYFSIQKEEEEILSFLASSVPDDSGRRESIIMESSTNEDCICSSIRMRLPIEDSILSIWIFTSWKEKEELSPVARPLT